MCWLAIIVIFLAWTLINVIKFKELKQKSLKEKFDITWEENFVQNYEELLYKYHGKKRTIIRILFRPISYICAYYIDEKINW